MDNSLSTWTPEALRRISAGLEGEAPEAVLRWGLEHFSGQYCPGSDQSATLRNGMALATGFGPEGVALMHMVSKIAPETTIFYLDTDLLFPETYALRDELAQRLGLRFTRVHSGLSLEAQAAEFGAALWSRNPDLCCQLRKVAPLRRFLATQQAWISAIRRDQTAARATVGLVEWDRANGLVKLNPLAAWTSGRVWDYVLKYRLPYNHLHDRGYPSIGCWPCTRAVSSGDDPRSGRWAGKDKTECGIHLQAPVPQPA